MITNEVLKFIDKKVEIQLEHNRKFYHGLLLKYDVPTLWYRKRTECKLVDENNNTICTFRPNDVRNIREV